MRAQVALPPLEARVTDLTGTLTAAQQSALEEKLAAFERRKGAQIAVLILPTTQPEDIAQFGIRLAEAWKLGRAAPDDGAILIVAKDDRAMRIEVGRGLEGALTDVTSSRIVNDTIAPLFKQGDFHGGVNAGLDQMIRVVDGEPLPAPDQRWKRDRARGLPVPVAAVRRNRAGTLSCDGSSGAAPAARIAGCGGGGVCVLAHVASCWSRLCVGVGNFPARAAFRLRRRFGLTAAAAAACFAMQRAASGRLRRRDSAAAAAAASAAAAAVSEAAARPAAGS